MSSPTTKSWTASNALKGATKGQGSTFKWTAPDRAERVTIEAEAAKPGGKPQTITFEVIEPQDVELEYIREATAGELHNAKFGAGMLTKVNFLPYSVSWAATEWKETPGGPSNKQGAFQNWDDTELMHKPNPKSIAEPRAQDRATLYMTQIPTDYMGNGRAGSFEWKIPNSFQVGPSGAPKEFVDTLQTMKIEGSPLDGYIQVTKKGATTGAVSSAMRGPWGKELPRKVEQAPASGGLGVEGNALDLHATGEGQKAPAPAPAAAPVQAIKPSLEVPVEVKAKIFESAVAGTPFKFEGELSTEVKVKGSSSNTANADKNQGAGVKGGPGLEIDLKEGVKVVTKQRVEKELNVMNLKFLGISERKRSKEGVEILVGFEKSGEVLGAPLTVKVTTGGTVGKKNELEVIGIEGSVDFPPTKNPLKLDDVDIGGYKFSGSIDWTMLKAKGALKADLKSVAKWLLEKGAMGAEAALPAMLTAMGAIGGPLVFAFLSINAFSDMENFDNRVSNLATQGAVACKRLPEFLHGAKSTNAVETAFVDQLMKAIHTAATELDKDPQWILENFRNNRDWQDKLRGEALASTKAACIAQGHKMADEFHDSKWISIFGKDHYREQADRIIEKRFSLVDGAGWKG